MLVVPGLLQLFMGFGVNFAVIRYSAYEISAGRPDEARRYSMHATYFMSVTGGVITLFNYFLAGPLAATLLHRPGLEYYVEISALATVGAALLQIVSFTSIGWNRMSLSSAFTVTQYTIKLVLSPLLVIVGLGVAGAVWGHVVSLLASGVLGIIAIYTLRLMRRGPGGYFLSDLRKMLGFGIPAYSGALFSNLAIYYVTVVLAAIADNTHVGLFSVAQNFVLPVTLVSTSLINGLFPAFATFDEVGGDARVAFKLAYKFVVFILLPLVVFLIPTAPLLIRVLYGANYVAGAPYLVLFALAYLPIAFGYTVHPAYFNGFGRPRLTFVVFASGAATLAVGSTLLSYNLGFGIEGIIYAYFASYLVAWAVGTFLAWKYMGASLDLKANAAIIAITAVAYLATASLPLVAHSSVASLLLDALVFFGIYLTLAPIAGAVTKQDLDVIGHAFSDLKVVGGAFALLIRYEAMVLSLRRRFSRDGGAPGKGPPAGDA